MKKRFFGLIIGLVLMQPLLVLAENRAETITYAPYVGGYTFQGKQHLETGPVFGFRLGYNMTDNWAIEGVIDYVKTEPTSSNANVGMLRYGGDLLYNFMPKNSFVPYLAAGVGGMNFNGNNMPSYTRAVFNYGGGVKWFLKEDVALRADLRGLNYSYGQVFTNIEYTLGLHIAVGAPPPAPKPVAPAPEPVVEQPKPAPVVVAPPPPAPVAELKAEPATMVKGGNVTLSWSSRNADRCELQPGGRQVAPSGSISVSPAESMKYTIVCSGAGGKATSAAPVTVTLPPPPKEETGRKFSGAPVKMALNIQFDTGRNEIKKQYYEELKKVGDFMNQYDNVKGVIEGHTDNVGGSAFNQQLSQRRAEAVRNYIVTNFKVDKKRLSAKGFGMTRPVADNSTAAGRQQNRRIDAVIEEIPDFKPDADQPAAPAKQAKKPVKKAVKKQPAKK
jgi:OOP family OmpA-OmpF porin